MAGMVSKSPEKDWGLEWCGEAEPYGCPLLAGAGVSSIIELPYCFQQGKGSRVYLIRKGGL